VAAAAAALAGLAALAMLRPHEIAGKSRAP
jgi:hypothetical protein